MSKKSISTTMVHKMPADLQKAIISISAAKATWEDITPLARNEWLSSSLQNLK